MWRATGDSRYLDAAKRLADSAIASPVLVRGGVLTESCDVGQNSCDDNQKQFKGIFMRYLNDPARATNSATYQRFARQQSDSVWTADRDALNRTGQRWAGGSPNQVDWRTQASGLNAVLS